jgi:hypothetical protein
MGRQRTKRKYTKKSEFWNKPQEEKVVPDEIPVELVTSTDAGPRKLNPEMLIEVKEELAEPNAEQPKKQHEMFYSLAEGQMILEDEIRRKKEIAAKAQEEAEKQAMEAKKEPFLECPFCQNTQKASNSKDPTSAWCVRCGKAFSIKWKYK